jgi:hypothetical protein
MAWAGGKPVKVPEPLKEAYPEALAGIEAEPAEQPDLFRGPEQADLFRERGR